MDRQIVFLDKLLFLDNYKFNAVSSKYLQDLRIKNEVELKMIINFTWMYENS